jgi:hypothetical protein
MMKNIFKLCTFISLLLVLLVVTGCKEDYKKSSNIYDYELEERIRLQDENNPPEEGIYKHANGGPLDKHDYFKTRLNYPGLSTENLFHLYGPESFDNFKSREEYWGDDKIQTKFLEAFGSQAKYKFKEVYDNLKKEFSNFKKGIYSPNKSGYEIIRDDLSDLQSTYK